MKLNLMRRFHEFNAKFMRIDGFYTQHIVEVFIHQKNINEASKSSHLSQRSEKEVKCLVNCIRNVNLMLNLIPLTPHSNMNHFSYYMHDKYEQSFYIIFPADDMIGCY